MTTSPNAQHSTESSICENGKPIEQINGTVRISIEKIDEDCSHFESAHLYVQAENTLSSMDVNEVRPWICDRCKGIDLPTLFSRDLPPQEGPPRPVVSLKHRSFDDLDPECRICGLLGVIWNNPSLRPPYNLREAVSTHFDGLETLSKVLSARGLEMSGKHRSKYDAVSMSFFGFPSIKEISINYLDSLRAPKIDFTLLKSWIEHCSSKHGPECKGDWDPNLNPGMRLVHIKERRIVKNFQEALPYAALSYVYGAKSASPEGDKLPTKIPKTIKDAMDIAQKLGLEYLWVDRYCIRQDDSNDKNDQMSKMHHIYRGSHVTIIAGAGEGADYGIPGMSLSRSATPWAVLDRRLFISVFGLHQVVSRHLDSKWASRSWTYQESVLSKRLLYFTDFDCYFSCNQTDFTGLEEPLRNAVKADGFHPDDGPSEPGYLDSLWDIDEHIRDIRKRDISYESDRVNTIVGILGYMHQKGEIRGHLSGCAIFSKISDLSGYETNGSHPASSQPRIFRSDFNEEIFKTWEEGFVSGVATHCKDPVGGRREAFPSWSWAGWAKSQTTHWCPPPCEFLRDDNVRIWVEIDPTTTSINGMPKSLGSDPPMILSSGEFQDIWENLVFDDSICRFIRIEAPILHCKVAKVGKKWKVVAAEGHRVHKMILDEESLYERPIPEVVEQLEKSLPPTTIKGLVFKRYDGDCLVILVRELDGYYERIVGWQFSSRDFPFVPQVQKGDGSIVPLFNYAPSEKKPERKVLLHKGTIRLG